MEKPCQDCHDAYESAWDDQLVMLHRGCLDLLIVREQDKREKELQQAYYEALEANAELKEQVELLKAWKRGVETSPMHVAIPVLKKRLEAVIRDAEALWRAVDELDSALWTDDMKIAMPCLARTMDKER